MLRRKRFWFGLVISLGFLTFFLYRTDFRDILRALGEADYALALVSVPLYFVGFWIRTMRWRLLLRPVSRVSTTRLYPVVLIGLMANNILPARVGEFVRAYLVGQRESVSKSATLGTIAIDRVFDGFTLITILGIVIAFTGSDPNVIGIGVGTAVVFALAALVLALLAFDATRSKRLLRALLGLLPDRFEEPVMRLVESFLDGLGSLRSPLTLVFAAALSVASWLVETLMYWVVGQAFDLNVGFDVYLMIAAAANLALSILASPGGVGPFEVTTQAILIDLFNVARETASAYALALHALLLGPVILVGFVLLWATQMSLGEILGPGPTTVEPVPARPAAE